MDILAVMNAPHRRPVWYTIQRILKQIAVSLPHIEVVKNNIKATLITSDLEWAFCIFKYMLNNLGYAFS